MWKSIALAVVLTTAALWYDEAQPSVLPSVTQQFDPGSLAATVSLGSTLRDFGRTSQLKLWKAAFPVGNSGGQRLVINELDTTCDCGERSLRTFLVAPGETVDLIVTLDTRFARGEVENIASFTTNDPQRPRLNLTLRAFVDAPAITISELGDDRSGDQPGGHSPAGDQ